MLRWMMPCLVAVFAIGSAEAADGPVATKRAAYQAAKQLPPGLPRPHYAYRTTVTAAPPRYVRRGRQLVVEEYPAVLVYACRRGALRTVRQWRAYPAGIIELAGLLWQSFLLQL